MTPEKARMLKAGQWIYHRYLCNASGQPWRARVTSVKTWKRDPDRLEIRWKYGLYTYGTFTPSDLPDITEIDITMQGGTA